MKVVIHLKAGAVTWLDADRPSMAHLVEAVLAGRDVPVAIPTGSDGSVFRFHSSDVTRFEIDI